MAVKSGQTRRSRCGSFGRQQRRISWRSRLIKLRTIRRNRAPGDRDGVARDERTDGTAGLGANVDCRPEWLEQFGIMGSAYAKAVLKCRIRAWPCCRLVKKTRKGNQQVLEAAKLLEAAPVNFIGNVEGKDLFHNIADVVVVDGFVGNVVLKMGEGMIADLAIGPEGNDFGRQHLLDQSRRLRMLPALRRLRRKLRLRNLRRRAVAGIARKLHSRPHGRASRNAIKHAISRGGDRSAATTWSDEITERWSGLHLGRRGVRSLTVGASRSSPIGRRDIEPSRAQRSG